MIAMILAVDKNFLLGDDTKKNGIPWDILEDMQYFKKITEGKNVIAGRKTYEKMGPLPNRKNYMITKNQDLK